MILESWLKANGMEIARFANEGERLWVPARIKGRLLLVHAEVVVAAGDSARMLNEKHDLDRWYSVWDIYRRDATKGG